MMSVAILINEQWVFRFPKNEEGAEDLEKEIKIMPMLTERLTLAIPKFDYVGKQYNGLPFVGYRRLPGEILGEDSVPSLPAAERSTIAGQIATFIDELSSFPVALARELGVPDVDLRGEFVELFKQIKLNVFPQLDLAMQKYIVSRFENHFNHPSHFHYSPTLIHADLSPDHYLIDPIDRKLTGIIDFGDLQITDPDYEYTYILEDCGEDFARQVMESREKADIASKLKKVSFFVLAGHLAYIAEGVTRGNRDWVKEGIEAVRSEMANGNGDAMF